MKTSIISRRYTFLFGEYTAIYIKSYFVTNLFFNIVKTSSAAPGRQRRWPPTGSAQIQFLRPGTPFLSFRNILSGSNVSLQAFFPENGPFFNNPEGKNERQSFFPSSWKGPRSDIDFDLGNHIYNRNMMIS